MKKILLADDSLTIQKVVELTFMDEDYEVVAVGSGDEASLKMSEMTPDLVIADIHMPGVTGYDLCRQVKAQNVDLPVLLLVGTFESLDEDEVAGCGADGHLKKPFDSQELLRTVESLLSGGGEAAEPAPEAEPESEAESVEEMASGGSAAGFGFGAPASEDEDTEVADVSSYSASYEPAALEDVEPAPVDDEPEEVPEAPAVESAWAAPVAETTVAETAVADTVAAGGGTAPVDGGELSNEAVERIARKVVELLGDSVVREVAWEVVPDLAEVVIKDRIRELEAQVE